MLYWLAIRGTTLVSFEDVETNHPARSRIARTTNVTPRMKLLGDELSCSLSTFTIVLLTTFEYITIEVDLFFI